MAKPNYAFEKRQRELAKKKKKEEKEQAKSQRKAMGPGAETGDEAAAGSGPASPGADTPAGSTAA